MFLLSYLNEVDNHYEHDLLLENNPYDRETIKEIMELMLDIVCSRRQYIRIAGDDKPREVVKSQFLKLNSEHIEYVLASFKENVSKVRNIKQYLLASLWQKYHIQPSKAEAKYPDALTSGGLSGR